jgi:hypothetical protein
MGSRRLRRRMIDDRWPAICRRRRSNSTSMPLRVQHALGYSPESIGLEEMRLPSPAYRTHAANIRLCVRCGFSTASAGPTRSIAFSLPASRRSCRWCEASTKSAIFWRWFPVLRNRAALTTVYGVALLFGEIWRLMTGTTDSCRLLIRVELGKAGKEPLRGDDVQEGRAGPLATNRIRRD